MRPASIVMFDRLFLASLAISVVSFVLSYDTLADQFANDPAMARAGIGSGLVTGLMIGSVVIYLLLWFLISRKASNVAKWILVVLVALSLYSIAGSIGGPWGFLTILGMLSYALEVAAVVYLFRDDAKAWFRGEAAADPAAFD